ncbi:hypothetical protein [Paenibacillus sp. EPM92]|uniref:hypothetical protein n=1 Tax=Paenibacillus sp. EPM92 TaxID=1561195 RepID=UPI001915CB42|nr:hypothetical protein [Paenibacillus sp. EPM92]
MQNVMLTSRYKDYKPGRMLSLDDKEAAGVVSQGIGEYVTPLDPVAVFDKSEPELPTLEAFNEMKAEAQKQLLTELKIEGDAGNEEKRAALYAAYLQK